MTSPATQNTKPVFLFSVLAQPFLPAAHLDKKHISHNKA
jgi:hypothetical protein